MADEARERGFGVSYWEKKQNINEHREVASDKEAASISGKLRGVDLIESFAMVGRGDFKNIISEWR